MILKPAASSHMIASIPRESGDDPSPIVAAIAGGMYSPRERG